MLEPTNSASVYYVVISPPSDKHSVSHWVWLSSQMHGARINNESVTSGTDPLKKPVCPVGSAYDVRLGVDLFLKSESSGGSPEVFCACWDLKHTEIHASLPRVLYFTFIWINRGNYSPANMGWEIWGKFTAIEVPTLTKSLELSENYTFSVFGHHASFFQL